MKINSENYDNIKESLKEIKEIIKNFNSITIDGKEFKIKNYGGGDLKWLAIVMGINAANSKYSCPLCKWNSKIPVDINAEWTLDRSHKEAEECLKKNQDERFGYKHKAIFDFIQLNCFGIDPLHMPMRIIEKLFAFLIDYIEVSVDKNNSADLTKRPVFKKLWDFIETDCNISNPFYTKTKDNGDSKIKMRKTINKNERHYILQKMFETNKDTQIKRSLIDFFPEKHHSDNKLNVLT